jgi:hypothetical protein
MTAWSLSGSALRASLICSASFTQSGSEEVDERPSAPVGAGDEPPWEVGPVPPRLPAPLSGRKNGSGSWTGSSPGDPHFGGAHSGASINPLTTAGSGLPCSCSSSPFIRRRNGLASCWSKMKKAPGGEPWLGRRFGGSVSAADGGSCGRGATRRVNNRRSSLRGESADCASLHPPYGSETDKRARKKPGAVSRPGTVREFQFPEYYDLAICVNVYLWLSSPDGALAQSGDAQPAFRIARRRRA